MLETVRKCDECHRLDYVQQIKNKYIPEGDFISRKSIKAFIDNLLDLIVEIKENIIDFI